MRYKPLHRRNGRRHQQPPERHPSREAIPCCLDHAPAEIQTDRPHLLHHPPTEALVVRFPPPSSPVHSRRCGEALLILSLLSPLPVPFSFFRPLTAIIHLFFVHRVFDKSDPFLLALIHAPSSPSALFSSSIGWPALDHTVLDTHSLVSSRPNSPYANTLIAFHPLPPPFHGCSQPPHHGQPPHGLHAHAPPLSLQFRLLLVPQFSPTVFPGWRFARVSNGGPAICRGPLSGLLPARSSHLHRQRSRSHVLSLLSLLPPLH